jgi:putative ABC transport system permease protein
VQTAEAADPFDFKGLKSFVTFIKIFLLAFAGIALFVGAFIIFNTFAITVAQRTREFALLRTIGASRRQVLRSVVLEAFIIGLAATIVGAALGVLIAKFLNAVMKAAEIDLPQAGTVFSLRTVLVSLLVGVVVTVLASIIPAVRATRVAPVSVLREGSTMPKSRLSPATPFIAIGSALGGFALLLFGMFGSGVGTWYTCSRSPGERWRCSSASRCSRPASFVRSRGPSARRPLASRAHPGASPARTQRAIPVERRSLRPRS